MAIRQKNALLPLRNMAPRGVHPGWIRGAPGCTPCISTPCPLYRPSISPLSPLYVGDWWGVVGTGGEAPPEAPRLAAGHPVQCSGGGKSARLFAMGTTLDSDLVNVFVMILKTVSGKWPKRTLQKWSREGSVAARPSPIILLYIMLTGRSGCDGCTGDFP